MISSLLFQKIITLFLPEESSESAANLPRPMAARKKTTISIKAILWIVISIILGLILGQLH